MSRRRRAKRRIILFSAAILLVFAIAVFVVFREKSKPDENSSKKISLTPPAGTVRLGFNLPCAVYSADADRAYTAVRQRDKKVLMDMVAARRLRMLRQGTDIVISPAQGIAAVDVVGDDRGTRSCYIPLEMVDVIQHNRIK